MSATLLSGPRKWSLKRDQTGFRTYSIKFRVEVSSNYDGPGVALTASGLPTVGSTLNIDNEVDNWVYCSPELDIDPVDDEGKPNYFFDITYNFTNYPFPRCQTTSIDNPLDEPDRLSGSFVKYTREASKDRHGNPLFSSSWEQFRGSLVERDYNRPTVCIEMNLATLPLSGFAPMIDTVNDSSLWGLPKRCVKLSNASWSRKVYGTCSYYFVVTYEFDIDYNTFDKTIIDHGTKKLKPGGNKNDPRDFILATDVLDNPIDVILDGNGNPWNNLGTHGPGIWTPELYDESNFLLLGIPTSFS